MHLVQLGPTVLPRLALGLAARDTDLFSLISCIHLEGLDDVGRAGTQDLVELMHLYVCGVVCALSEPLK
jgi:hypothetical protein